MHKRLNNSVSQRPSIDPSTHSGRGTKQRVNDDNGLTTQRLGVRKIVRGGVEVAPMETVRHDLIAPRRMDVIARSGNDQRLHERAGTPNGGMWTAVGMGDEVAAGPSGMKTALFAAGLFGALWFITKAGR